MRIAEIMTHKVEVISPKASLVEAARRMKDIDSGALPVCDGDRIQGLVTDRDIVIKCLAVGEKMDQCTVKDAMTSPVQYIFADQDIQDAAERMQQKQIRRLVVLNSDKRLVGFLTLGDLALAGHQDRLSAETLKSVCEGTRRSFRKSA